MTIGEATINLQRSGRLSAKTSFYRPELDALRFLAFFLVFLHHGLSHDPLKYSTASHNLMVRGFCANIAISFGAGLPLFFVLSAYLIASLLLREKEKTSTVHISAFYIRRILRIWPLYFFALLASFLVSRFITGFHGWGIYVTFMLMAANLTLPFHLMNIGGPLGIGHLWSISVEEQFYMAFPYLAKVLNKSSLFILCFGMGITALATLAYLSHFGQALAAIWTNSLVQFLMFACGISLAVYFSSHRVPDFRARTRLLLICSGLTLCVSSQVFCEINGAGVGHSAAKLMVGYMFMATGCSCLLLSFLGTKRKIPGILVYLGKISYGLYVFHAWGLELGRYVVDIVAKPRLGAHFSGSAMGLLEKDCLALVFTVLTATLSYYLFETPFLRLKDRFAFVRSRPV